MTNTVLSKTNLLTYFDFKKHLTRRHQNQAFVCYTTIVTFTAAIMLSRIYARTCLVSRRVASSYLCRNITPAVASISGACNLPGHWGNSNITASEGQGGFFGSGGARAAADTTTGPTTTTAAEYRRPDVLALAADVRHLTMIMQEIDLLEKLLHRETEDHDGQVTGRSIEIRAKMKKLVTSRDFMDCLNRLEIRGEPVWGLSMHERDLIALGRDMVNRC